MEKIMFCINLTDNKKNTLTDDQALVSKRVEDWQQADIDKLNEQVDEVNKRASLPSGLQLAKILAGLASLIIGSNMLVSLIYDQSFARIIDNAAVLVYIFPFAFILWLFLTVYEKRLQKRVAESAEPERINSASKTVMTNAQEEFNIPQDAVIMDFLAYRYTIKNNTIKIKALGFFTHVGIVMSVFVKEDQLCFANLEQLVEIPISDIVSVERVNKNAMMGNWNKEIPHNQGQYKRYKLKNNQYGTIFVKPYYIVHINVQNQLFSLVVPVYEISSFIKITGLDYQDEYTTEDSEN